MTITVRITVTEEDYLEAKKEFEEVNDFEYTKEMFMEDQLDYFYADCREYIVDFADVDVEMIQKGVTHGRIQKTSDWNNSSLVS